eukprot:TRINITY_DN6694_c0_g2_i2.p1 TRINITY_DN6694_c0_g2~~TRINITY_DN6694_c0_g2_i2.p1  ORF type:complete len:395 (+),score=66.61 TRINITY_DN6694_c0_g2_i2:807-1991(+)
MDVQQTLSYLGRLAARPGTREKMMKDEWPINFGVKALSSPVPAIRESAAKVLTQMCEFDDLKDLIHSKLALGPVIRDVVRRGTYTEKDFFYHSLISQLLDYGDVQEIATRQGYVRLVTNCLHSDDPLMYSLSVISIAKLTRNELANSLIAETDAFYKLYNLITNPQLPVEVKAIQPGLATLYLITKPMAKHALANLYYGKNSEKALVSVPTNLHPLVGAQLFELKTNDPSSASYRYRGEVIMYNCGLPTFGVGLTWGFIRTLISNRMKFRGTPKFSELKLALKGSLKSAFVTPFLVLLLTLGISSREILLHQEPSREKERTLAFMGPFSFILFGFLSQRVAPYTLLPSVLGLGAYYASIPVKETMWLEISQTEWEKRSLEMFYSQMSSTPPSSS